MKDTDFYNAESLYYSAKRYPAKPSTFTQYFFTKRLALTLDLLKRVPVPANASLLEIGPADGVVIRAVWDTCKDRLSTIEAVDASEGMIQAARKMHADTPIRFSVRGPIAHGAYDVVLETGVINYLDYKAEFAEVMAALKPHGVYIVSAAGYSSLQNRLKGAEGYRNLLAYAAYEAELQKYFTIEHTLAVGFFVPLLWHMPALARVLQPAVEVLLSPFKNLALEKIYVARLK